MRSCEPFREIHPFLSTVPYSFRVIGVPRILGWCRNNFTFPNQPKEWARLVPEAAAQYSRLQSWRAEQAQVTDEVGSTRDLPIFSD